MEERSPLSAPAPAPVHAATRWRDRWRRLGPAPRVALVAVPAALALVGLMWFRCGFAGCPDVDRLTSFQPGRAPVVLDRRGRAFADLAPVAGQTVPLRQIPRHVREAFLAVEDRRFYEHDGVDWRRVGGALLANLRSGGFEEGFSTLTMQLARNVFPDRLPGRKRTLLRKVLEVRVALEIEAEFEKDEILELYLNHIYFGNGARGIEAAARHYFGVAAGALTLRQAALLAALPRGPALYDPRRHPREARQRRDLVLSLMEEQGRISPAEASSARSAPLGVLRRGGPAGREPGLAPYYVEEVRRVLEDVFGEELYDETLRIHTTLDAGMQRAAEEELGRQLRAIESGAAGRFRGPAKTAAAAPDEGTPYLQGAVVVLDPVKGDVLAWVGGRDFRHSRFDRVRSGRRQLGSAFKPFVYAAALASGRTLSQRIADEPLRVALGGRRFWEPRNFDGSYEGQVTLRDALVRSKNVPTVRLFDSVGYANVAALAERAGITETISARPSTALGTVSVSPLELAAAYTSFASLGERVDPRLLLRVERPDGKVLWEAEEPQRLRVLDAGVAFLVTDALREALARGTGASVRGLGYRGAAAGKTGTTSDGTDAWFVGYTPRVVAAVWIGFDQPRPITSLATGGRLAAPVWARLMLRVPAGGQDRGWPVPSEVMQARVDPASGFILVDGCEPYEGVAYREYFLRGVAPPAVCPYQGPPATVFADLEPLMPDDEASTDLALDLPEELRDLRAAERALEEAREAAAEAAWEAEERRSRDEERERRRQPEPAAQEDDEQPDEVEADEPSEDEGAETAPSPVPSPLPPPS